MPVPRAGDDRAWTRRVDDLMLVENFRKPAPLRPAISPTRRYISPARPPIRQLES
jgi:hypothetical protein